jgi:hypothetical protein
MLDSSQMRLFCTYRNDGVLVFLIPMSSGIG